MPVLAFFFILFASILYAAIPGVFDGTSSKLNPNDLQDPTEHKCWSEKHKRIMYGCDEEKADLDKRTAEYLKKLGIEPVRTNSNTTNKPYVYSEEPPVIEADENNKNSNVNKK